MGNGYFRTSQTRKDKRKTKEFTYNYVDRIRLAESSLQDHPNYPIRASGWRHTSKSVSHLDLATSCHSAASGLNHWPAARQLRPSRSLDYNHINRCKDALDIAEYYWRIDPEEHYNDEVGQKSEPHQHCQYKEALYRDYADENYHSTNSIYSSQQHQQTQHQHQQQKQQQSQPLHHHTQQQQAQPQQQPIQPFDIGNDSCSLRRSRSLAVIREETFSDLQITSTNSGRRRSQLIPRARLVNRGFFREHETRFNCANSKHHHHHHSSREKLTNGTETDLQSNGSGTGTCDSHQHQHHLKQQQQQQQQQQQHHHHHHHHQGSNKSAGNNHHQSREADDYYDNLKRLDSLAVGGGVGGENLHPWHNDKSDLESLNSDYFKNSLHQSHEHKQQQAHQQQQQLHQQQQQAQQQQLSQTAVATDKTERIEKPRIYQSRRQQRTLIEKHTIQQQAQQQKLTTANTGVDSCPENSQSSVFPETTTSNSDDQTDSLSLSEQEYDLTRIEEIFQKTQLDADDIDAESYELISLTTTTRTRIETTEEEDEDDADDGTERDYNILRPHSNEHTTTTTTDTEIEGTLKRARALSENLEKLIAYDSVYLSSEEGSEGTLIDEHCEELYIQQQEEVQETTTTSTTLLHISIEDTVFDSPLAIEEDTQLGSDTEEEEIVNDIKSAELVHTNITREQENNHEHTKINCDIENQQDQEQQQQSVSQSIAFDATPIYTQILKVEHANSKLPPPLPITTVINTTTTSSAATKPRILAVVEKRKLKRAADTANEVTQRASTSVDHSSVSPCLHLTQRPVTEALYASFKPNLIDNQYHSLPDVNIGKSLKVSERIDAKLRSSYNLNKYQVNEEEVIDCCVVGGGKEATGTPSLLLDSQSSHSKLRQKDDGGVTTAEIYDSIKRFGRAHQKARQREYQNLHEPVVVKEKSDATREKKQRVESSSGKDIKAIKHIKVEQLSEQTAHDEVEEAISRGILQQHGVCEKNHDDDEHSRHYDDAPLAPAIENSNFTAETEILENLSDVSIQEEEKYVEKTKVETQQIIETDADYLEQPKEAPSIEVPTFTREIEQRAKEIKQSKVKKKRQRLEEYESETFTSATFRIQKSTNNFTEESSSDGLTNQFKIIVTDAQNNIIEEDSIEGNHSDSLNDQREDFTKQQNFKQNTLKKIEKINLNPQKTLAKEKTRGDKSTTVSHNHHRVSSLKRVPSKPKRLPAAVPNNSHQQQTQHQATNSETAIAIKSKERRVLGTQIYKARPVKVLSSNDSFRRAAAAISCKMSRPQILHVVDNKRSAGGGTDATTTTTCCGNAAQIEGNQLENEYMKKVDSVRCYWSKLAQSEQSDKVAVDKDKKQQKNQCNATSNNEQLEQSRHFNLGATATTTTDVAGAMRANKNSNEMLLTTTAALNDEFCSFMPSIEIVDLNGEKRATIVSAVPPNATAAATLSNDASEPQFDHIRYKVMKSQQLIRSNILARNKKEAQFDGLIQYLQEYSFQELLSNNNVVIVEPVRTKIERPLMTTALKSGYSGGGTTTPSSASTITEATANQFAAKDSETETVTNGTISPACSSTTTTTTTGTNKQSSAIKRHFFYQPVRVNRELYEEELPNPDTVRNVRKFFEEHILPTPGLGITVQQRLNGESKQHEINKQLSPRSRRARKFRYLTIDTSYGHANISSGETTAAAAQQHKELPTRKWDTASLSSGISSGDLSSPCDCNDATDSAAGQNHNHNESKRTEELKGVHVKDFIRRHNTIGDEETAVAAATTDDATAVSKAKRLLRPRPRSVYGTVGEHSYYRDIYEYNARQGYDTSGGDGTIYARRRSNIADGEIDMFAGDGDDDGDGADGVDIDDDELNESYYVSNDVLEKIRECGSSVTYYGGRVLPRISPEPHNNQYHHHNSTTTAATTVAGCDSNGIHNTATTMTFTRALVKEFETCGTECQTRECPHSKQMNVGVAGGVGIQKQLTTTVKREQKNDALPASLMPPMRVQQQNDQNNDAYLGKSSSSSSSQDMDNSVRFKLIKSNSCSSRLELAGAEDENSNSKHKGSTHMEVVEEPQQEDTDVVKDIVKRLEATRNTASRNNIKHEIRKIDSSTNNGLKRDLLHSGGSGNEQSNMLTINNQMPVKCDSDIITTTTTKTITSTNNNKIKEDATQVTVNNHINVPISVFSSIESLNKAATATTPKSMQREKFNNTENEAQNNMEKTYQSSAMGIRLDMPTTTMLMSKEKCHNNNNTSNDSSQSNNNNNAKDNENANGTNTTKICRNKNVDLAFTMTKQQQQQQQPHTNTFKSTGTTKDNRKSFKTLEQTEWSEDIIKNTPVLSHNELKDIMPNVTVPSVTKTFTPHLLVNNNDNNNSNSNNQKTSLATAADDTIRVMGKSQKNLVENFENAIKTNADKPKLMTTRPAAAATATAIKQPTTIIVPVEIHQRSMESAATTKPNYKSNDLDKLTNLSCCSSTASIDKAFVRHYVANDKSLFEGRKYDDIEFEEFEVYDPSKEIEQQLMENRDDNGQKQQQHNKSKTSSISDLSSLNDDKTDCYDSLDDRL